MDHYQKTMNLRSQLTAEIKQVIQKIKEEKQTNKQKKTRQSMIMQNQFNQ